MSGSRKIACVASAMAWSNWQRFLRISARTTKAEGRSRLESDGDGQVGEGTLGLAEPPESLGTYQVGRGFLGGGGDDLGRLLDGLGELLASQGGFGLREGGRLVIAGGRHDPGPRSLRPGIAMVLVLGETKTSGCPSYPIEPLYLQYHASQ